MTEPSHAVFLSYASQDAEAAQRICETLRAAGIEVWFDQSELRGGDAWDRRIRQQIHDCRLFIAAISAHSEARHEGYFRREWRLAVERAGDMSERVAFLIPVVVDDTRDSRADVPDRFREVQWTRLPGGETPPAFVERIKCLLSPEPPTTARPPADGVSGSARIPLTTGRPSPWRRVLPVAVAVLAAAALAYALISKPWMSKPAGTSATSNATSSAPVAPTAFNPPAHSIAVLPFVNMSGDKDQEYFSEGLTEELLNSLAEINELQVAARTSAFSFKGTNTDIGTIARKLNVGAVLEGSVRRSGNTVRITTQLINAVTGFHTWTHSYDRNLGDVLKLETEIASAVASALKVSLLTDVAAKIELGGTRNPAAFDAYLRGVKVSTTYHRETDLQSAMAEFSEAIRLDPSFALAFANRSLALSRYADSFANGPAITESFDKAQSDALKAIALAPDLAEAHLALARYLSYARLDFSRAHEEYERASTLAPGNERVLGEYGVFATQMGRKEAGIAAARRAVLLDPLNRWTHFMLGGALLTAHQYKEAVAAYQESLALDPDNDFAHTSLGLAYYALGSLQSAQASCESKSTSSDGQICLAIIYDKLGRHTDAEAMLAKCRTSNGDADAYGYAEIYAQWGYTSKALEWLETALRLRNPGLQSLKTDPLLDSLRNEPRFQAVEKALNFPN